MNISRNDFQRLLSTVIIVFLLALIAAESDSVESKLLCMVLLAMTYLVVCSHWRRVRCC